MNTIRTTSIELTSIPAISYKYKLKTGGAGIKIHRLDITDCAAFTFDKRSGELVPYGKVNEENFPINARQEAVIVTTGLPYSSRTKVVVPAYTPTVEPAENVADVVEDNETETFDMVNSREYSAIIDAYTDNGTRLNFARMNKDFIQFASRSKAVSKLSANGASLEDLLVFVVKNRVQQLAKTKALSDAEVKELIEVLDDICVRSAFKELNAHLRRK